MADVQWKDSYALGLEPMDQTHREFVALRGAAAAADAAGMPAALEALAAHTAEHFEMERRWMEETDFPPQHCHKGEHENVLMIVREVSERVGKGETDLGRQLALALEEWFEGHAATMDAMLSAWMLERDTASAGAGRGCAPQAAQA